MAAGTAVPVTAVAVTAPVAVATSETLAVVARTRIVDVSLEPPPEARAEAGSETWAEAWTEARPERTTAARAPEPTKPGG